MIEADYTKWSNEKNEIENFDKLSEPLQKAIYDLEQELKDHEEVELYEITLSDSDEILELEFEWIGHGEYCVMVGRSIYEGCEHDENENPNDDDFYDMGQESVDRAGFEMMHEKISGYLHPYISHNKIVVSK